jgi:tRNA/rRNA methyltransferase
MTQSIFTPTAAAEAAISLKNDVKVGIMFGRERNGLTNEEVALSDSIISIPSFKHFSSLNLAQAVNIVGFELFKRNLDLGKQMPPDVWLNPKDGQRLARRAELDFFLGRVEASLDERYFQKNPDIRDANYRNIRSIFQRTLMTRAEVDLMHGVLTSLVKPPRVRDDGDSGTDSSSGSSTGSSTDSSADSSADSNSGSSESVTG